MTPMLAVVLVLVLIAAWCVVTTVLTLRTIEQVDTWALYRSIHVHPTTAARLLELGAASPNEVRPYTGQVGQFTGLHIVASPHVKPDQALILPPVELDYERLNRDMIEREMSFGQAAAEQFFKASRDGIVKITDIDPE